MGLLLVAASCGRRAVPSVTTKVTDSTYVSEVPRIVEVKIPGYKLGIRTIIECDSNTNKPKPLQIEKHAAERAHLAVQVTGQSELIVDSRCDSLVEEIEVRDKLITRLQTKSTDTVHVETEYKTRQIDIVCRWIAGGTALYFGGAFALKYIRNII